MPALDAIIHVKMVPRMRSLMRKGTHKIERSPAVDALAHAEARIDLGVAGQHRLTGAPPVHHAERNLEHRIRMVCWSMPRAARKASWFCSSCSIKKTAFGARGTITSSITRLSTSSRSNDSEVVRAGTAKARRSGGPAARPLKMCQEVAEGWKSKTCGLWI